MLGKVQVKIQNDRKVKFPTVSMLCKALNAPKICLCFDESVALAQSSR